MPRFSKAILTEYITKRLTYLEATHGFDRANGWAQVQGLGEELNRLYGEYKHLKDLAQKFGLPTGYQALPIPKKVHL